LEGIGHAQAKAVEHAGFCFLPDREFTGDDIRVPFETQYQDASLGWIDDPIFWNPRRGIVSPFVFVVTGTAGGVIADIKS